MAKLEFKNPDGSIDPTKEQEINDYSIYSMCMDMYFDDQHLSSGTVFFVSTAKGPALITNRHNFTGRHQETGLPLDTVNSAVPNNVEIYLFGITPKVVYVFDLYHDTEMTDPVWIEHPLGGSAVDVVGVLFSDLNTDNYTSIRHFHEISESWKHLSVTDRVHVVGFPFRCIRETQMAVWATGYIATEPALSYGKFPGTFLVDCRSRPGQSGSPVLAQITKGETVVHEGRHFTANETVTFFIGVYSGRINAESDLGIVWKSEIVREIVSVIDADDTVHAVSGAGHRKNRRSKFF